MLERFINPAYAAKQCRHYDSGHVFFRNPLIAKLQLGEQSRRHQHRYQLIDDADSDFACRQQRDQRHDQANRRWSALHYLQNHAQCHHREERNPAKIESVRMPLRPAIYPFARRRSVTDATFENPTSFVDQEITDVRMPRVARIGKLRQLDNFTRNFFFRSLHTLPNVLDDVPVVVASSESHRRVMPAWILAKQLLRRALRFDEILPVESRDCAQAGDTESVQRAGWIASPLPLHSVHPRRSTAQARSAA